MSESWLEKRARIAAAVIAKIGTVTLGADGENYVVSESLRRKIAKALMRQQHEGVSFNIDVTIDDWFTVPPCPVQRNTEEHYKERAEHFAVVTVAQKEVIISVQENGDIFVLDGHTRTHGWKKKLIHEDEIPKILNCAVRCVKDEEATKREYYTIDSAGQSKDGRDQLFSACRVSKLLLIKDGFIHRGHGLVDALRSTFMLLAEHGRINKSMLQRATKTPNLGKRCKPEIKECVQRFKEALCALDSLKPTGKFKGAVAQAFILAYEKYVTIGFGDKKKDYEKLMEFFVKFRDGVAEFKDGAGDAVYRFDKIREWKGGGQGARKQKLPHLLGCIERYIEAGPHRRYREEGEIIMEDYFKHRTALKKGKSHKEGRARKAPK